MKNTMIRIFLLLFLASNLNAQTMLNGLMQNFNFTKKMDGTYARNNLKLSDIQGSPFLDEEFSPAKLYTNDGAVYENIPMRYNAYSDELEFQKEKDNYNIDPKSVVKRLELGGMIFCCMKYDDGGKSKEGYFEVLTQGKATLLVKYSIKFLEKEEVKAFADPKPARFEEAQKEHYFSMEGAAPQLIISKKNLLQLLEAHKSEMESYISKNKLSVRSDDDLTKIVVHYNSL